jgi:hypothetical protein
MPTWTDSLSCGMYQLKSLTKYTSGLIIPQGFCFVHEWRLQICRSKNAI